MLKITKVGVLSMGKIGGATGLIFGLLFGLIYGGVFTFMGLVASGQQGGGPPAAAMVGMGIGMMIFLPLVYGGMCFVGGLIYALVLNLLFGIVGGFEIELSDIEGNPVGAKDLY